MSNATDINFMPSLSNPGGGGGVIVAGAGPVAIAGSGGVTFQPGTAVISIKRIRAVRVGVGAGVAGNFILSDSGGVIFPDLKIPIPASVTGTTIIEDFPVPFRGLASVSLEVEAGMGDWAVTALGFYSA